MRIHYLQHVPFEDLAAIKPWAESKEIVLSRTCLFDGEPFPDVNDIDGLIIVGGPMGVYEENKYPWMHEEKKYIETAIKKDKKVLGICLGAQLIANVLGAKVYKNKYKEIGWFDIKLTGQAKTSKLFKSFPDTFKVFQWHGDTFDTPTGVKNLASSIACKNQAFEYNRGQVAALQFHIESSTGSIKYLLQNCNDELIKDSYIQSSKEIQAGINYIKENNRLMTEFLTHLLIEP
ncbi:MAG: type 1 glutamine amidotransferase [Candidatus Margulisbacteria bacterium]|nr:type 1 glutamine amidotransferase [Candidatus Margulisiibacteriota bacterium]